MKYPYDIFKAANQKATFTVEGHFVSAMEESPMKVFNQSGCRPLQRKVREDGKCFCYEGKVTYNPAMNYPVTVEIKSRVIKKREKSFGTFFFCHKTKNGQIYDIIPYT